MMALNFLTMKNLEQFLEFLRGQISKFSARRFAPGACGALVSWKIFRPQNEAHSPFILPRNRASAARFSLDTYASAAAKTF